MHSQPSVFSNLQRLLKKRWDAPAHAAHKSARRNVHNPGVMEPARIKEFAAEFDPQPFHLDERAAQASIFKGLAASGWHTAAVAMRLLVTGGLPFANGNVGL